MQPKLTAPTHHKWQIPDQQGSLFSKAYHPLAQQYFSTGPLPPPLLHPLLGGGSTSVFSSGGGPLPCSLLGGSTSVFTSRGSTSVFISSGSHVTYPIMLLYTTIECPSASWAKFTSDPPPGVEQTDRQTWVKTLASRTTWWAVIIMRAPLPHKESYLEGCSAMNNISVRSTKKCTSQEIEYPRLCHWSDLNNFLNRLFSAKTSPYFPFYPVTPKSGNNLL